MNTYSGTCIFDGWRIDAHIVYAASLKLAKAKVRKAYTVSPRRITSIRLRQTA